MYVFTYIHTYIHTYKTICRLHNIIKTQTTFKSQQTKTEHQIRTDLNCDSVNVVYLITCNLCKKQYVGQSQNQLRIRTVCHRYVIRHEVDTQVANNFNLPGHSLEENLKSSQLNNPRYLAPKLKLTS